MKSLLIFSVLLLGGCVGDKNHSQQTKALPLEAEAGLEESVKAIDPKAITDPVVAKVKTKPQPEKASPVPTQTNPDPSIDLRRKGKYKIKGKRYEIFASGKNFQEIGNASWYGPGFHGKLTANGEKYNMNAMTAAHKTLPLGIKVQVTNLATGKKIIVRINDRGPFHGGRIIDLSKAAAKSLNIIKHGYAKVHIKTLN